MKLDKNKLFALLTSIQFEDLGTEDEPSEVSKASNRIWSYIISQGFPFSNETYKIPIELRNTLNILNTYYNIPTWELDSEPPTKRAA